MERATVYCYFSDLGALTAGIICPKHNAMVATLRAAEGINDVLVALLKYRRMLSSERALLCFDEVRGMGAVEPLKEDMADFMDQGSDAAAFYGRVLVDAVWPRGEGAQALSAGLVIDVIARISGLVTQIKAVIANDRTPTTVVSRADNQYSLPWSPCHGLARLPKRVNLPSNDKCTSPIGPWRCLPIMTSALP